MGKAVERIFLPLMRLTIPEIVDINLPVEGVFHNLMIVSIRKSYPGQARKVMNAIWSLGQAMFTKCIIVVDEDVNVQDIADVTLKVLNHIDPERDIQFTLGPVDSLDHASRLPNYGSKMGIDATRKWPTEGFTRPWPDEILMDERPKLSSTPNGKRSPKNSESTDLASLSVPPASTLICHPEQSEGPAVLLRSLCRQGASLPRLTVPHRHRNMAERMQSRTRQPRLQLLICHPERSEGPAVLLRCALLLSRARAFRLQVHIATKYGGADAVADAAARPSTLDLSS